MSSSIPTYVLHLDEFGGRARNVAKIIQENDVLDVSIIKGIRGSDLPITVRAALSDDDRWANHPGEIGCFLSHVKAWEQVARMSNAYCIILEDDALCDNIARFNQIKMPSGADLIFLNDRMSINLRPGDNAATPSCIHWSEALKNFSNDGKLIRRDIGADGYALSPTGASRLLSAIRSDLYFGHVDWRLLRYCVTEAEIVDLFGDDELGYVIRHHHNPRRPPKWGILTAWCLDQPLVRHGKEESVRNRENAIKDLP